MYQIDKGTCLVGIDQTRQLAKVGIEDAHRFRRLGGGVVFRSLRQAEGGAAEQGDHEQQKGDVSGHGESLLVMGQLKCSQPVTSPLGQAIMDRVLLLGPRSLDFASHFFVDVAP